MSVSCDLLCQASSIAMRECVRKNWLADAATAQKIVPIAMAIALRVLEFKARSYAGARSLVRLLDRHPEDLLRNEHRLAAADVRARGAALVDRTMKRGALSAAQSLAEIGSVDAESAANVLAMATAAAVSTMAKVKRDLHLTASELRGVIKSEAALVPDAEPAVAAEIWRSVLRAKRWSPVMALNGFILRKLGETAELFSKKEWRESPAAARARLRLQQAQAKKLAQAKRLAPPERSNVMPFPRQPVERDYARVRVESERLIGGRFFFPSGREASRQYS